MDSEQAPQPVINGDVPVDHPVDPFGFTAVPFEVPADFDSPLNFALDVTQARHEVGTKGNNVDSPAGFVYIVASSVVVPVAFGSPRSDEVAGNKASNPGETAEVLGDHPVNVAPKFAYVSAFS
uniref:Uncharacterized protein n=1 Tax=Peronospora matthiolae TaxID=2874970 RepID=A0AAV1U1N2_9STRA